jgi:shikimate dehydrogenase
MNVSPIYSELARLQSHLSNRFDDDANHYSRFAGIIGDRPSLYAKSPILWNAAFRTLDLNAIFLPFDVDEKNLKLVVEDLRQSENLLGFSVTVPYKIKVLEFLDDIDPMAARIGAINTVVRTSDGSLVGYNTDGSGFLAALQSAVVEPPLLNQVSGIDVLLIGAGGAARAVAFYLAEAIAPGRLFIANRTNATATALAKSANNHYGNVTAINEEDITKVATEVGLIVNSSTRGQAGLRELPNGFSTMLEPYSALAPANPSNFTKKIDVSMEQARHDWFNKSLSDIEENNQTSRETVARVPISSVAYDLIYAPTETVFLSHFRQSGHQAINGKGMNVAQAVDGFCDRVCADYLAAKDFNAATVREQVVKEMIRVW